MYQYFLCGLKVESDLPFPELSPWEGSSDAPAQIEFRLDRLDDLATESANHLRFEVLERNKILFTRDGLGRILIEDGRRMIFDPHPNADSETVRMHFIGTVQSVIWHQRGNLPLHGTTVETGGRAIAVAGPSGTGKSAVAAALLTSGSQVVADDLTVVDFSGGRATVLPGYERLRLCRDACEEFHLLGEAIADAHPTQEKYVLGTRSSFREPLSLSDIFILTKRRPEKLTIDRLNSVRGVQSLLTAVHTLNPARALELQEQIFRGINTLVAKVRLWRLGIPRGLANTREAAEVILDLVGR